MAVTYGWGGTSSADWTTTANWQGGAMAPTGGAYDVTIVVTNKANSVLTYTAANGYTAYAATSGRALRIADGVNGSMAITGGILETRGSGGGDFVGNSTGVGSLLIDGGTYVSTNGAFNVGANNGVGTLTVNSGWARLATLNCWSGAGTVNLNGGLLTVGTVTWQTGSTAIKLNGGTLQAGKNVATSWFEAKTNISCTVVGNIPFDTQDYYVTNSLPLSGAGTMTKVGSGLLALNVSNTLGAVVINEGTLALGGSNTFSAGVTLNAGTLAVNHAAALGSTPLAVNGGRIDSFSSLTTTNVLNTPINIYSNFTFVGTRDLNLGTGTVTLCNNVVISNAAKTLTLGGSVGDGGSNYPLRVTGTGVLELAGSLMIGSGRAIVAGVGSLALSGVNALESLTLSEATISLNSSNAIGSIVLSGGTLNINHPAALGTGVLAVCGGRLDSTSSVTTTNALNTPINVYSNFTFVGTKDLNLGASPVTLFKSVTITNLAKTMTWASSVGDNGSNYALNVVGGGMLTITGNLGIGGRVTVAGNGSLTLASANSYTGATTVSGGTLFVAHNNALGATNGVTEVSGPYTIQLLNNITVADETINLGGQGVDNKGALQAASGGTSTWNGPIVLNEYNPSGWTPRLGYKSSGVLMVLGPIKPGVGSHLWISGDQASGRVVIASTNNTYTGITGIIRGTLALGANNALPIVTTLDMHPASAATEYSRFDLNGFNQTLAALYETTTPSPRIVTNSSDTASVLTVKQNANTVYSGRITGNLGLVKDGSGSLTLAGTNTYTGTTALKNGTLVIGCDGALSPDTPLVISNGTLNAGAWINSAKQLAVVGTAVIDLGSGAGVLTFADSSSQTWTGTLNLIGTLEPRTIRFGTGAAGLTQEQLDLIRVNDVKAGLYLNAEGYLRKITGTIFRVQ
jgi:autotransporter-associated beta strand protein